MAGERPPPPRTDAAFIARPDRAEIIKFPKLITARCNYNSGDIHPLIVERGAPPRSRTRPRTLFLVFSNLVLGFTGDRENRGGGGARREPFLTVSLSRRHPSSAKSNGNVFRTAGAGRVCAVCSPFSTPGGTCRKVLLLELARRGSRPVVGRLVGRIAR